MHIARFAGLAALAALGAQAQVTAPPSKHAFEPLVVTAARTITDPLPTLRDAVVVTREQLDAAGPLTLAEALQRFAGVEIGASGGPGQPASLFLRGAGSTQTLVLVDGLRVGAASTGATAIEAIPLDMIERIEVVKGPMSSLWGSDAIGGVVQVFTRGKNVPHLFGSVGYGSDNDRRLATGLSTVEGDSQMSLNAGARRVDARSASNERAGFFYDPDRDPHENGFVNFRGSHRAWNGEILTLEGFASRNRTHFDGGSPDDRTRQDLAGARVASSTEMLPWWVMRLTAGYSVDDLHVDGGFPSHYETRQAQYSLVNEIPTGGGKMLVGVDLLRQKVQGTGADGAAVFVEDHRDTYSYFASLAEEFQGQRFEGNVRHDDDKQFGGRTTGSLSLGSLLTQDLYISGTYAEGFRAPSFNDLYYQDAFYVGDPTLRPEKSRSGEITVKPVNPRGLQWRITGFQNRVTDMISTQLGADGLYRAVNVARAKVRGVELAAEATWWGVNVRGSATFQKPRDEDTDRPLARRADRYGTLEAAYKYGAFTFGANVVASAARPDPAFDDPSARTGGYARVDARVRYTAAKYWSAELAVVNLNDKRYETVRGFDAPHRGVFLNVRFDAF